MASSSVRNLRIMLLGGILFTGIATGSVYIAKRRGASTTKHIPVKAMDYSTKTQTQDFKMSRTEGGKTVFRAVAKKAIDFRESGKSQLEDLEIFIFGKNGDRNDKITTKNCDYDSNTGLFFAPGEVQIELASLGGVEAKAAPDPNKKPVHITTTGMTFDQKKNVATTDQDLHFEFSKGTGDAKGAVYDSTEQMFWLRSNVVIHITNGAPTEVRAVEMRYFEKLHQIHLVKPEVLRTGQKLASDTGVMYLDEKQQAKNALLEGNVHGVNDHAASPGVSGASGKLRHTEFLAARLDLNLDEKQHIHDASASATPGGVVRMDSQGPTGRTEARATRLDMDYTGLNNSLKQAEWKGAAKIVMSPAPGQAKAQTRVITAEQIEMNMKPGGKELANARTITPGRFEMTGGGEPHRVLTAREIWADFNDRNALNQMRATGQVRTESEPPANAPVGSPLRITTSDRLEGSFNGQQQLEHMAQSGNFQYTEGDRHATADSAVYTLPPGAPSGTGLTVLIGTPAADPRVWDPGGAVIAKKLTMPEKNGESIAEGNVRATQIQAKDNSKKQPGIFGS